MTPSLRVSGCPVALEIAESVPILRPKRRVWAVSKQKQQERIRLESCQVWPALP